MCHCHAPYRMCEYTYYSINDLEPESVTEVSDVCERRLRLASIDDMRNASASPGHHVLEKIFFGMRNVCWIFFSILKE